MRGRASEIDNSDLPILLAEIAGVIGREPALRLAEAKGGTTIFMPAKIRHNHWLAALLGHDVAQQLSEHFRFVSAEDRFNGLRLAIPSAAAVRRANSQQACFEQGLSVRQAAALTGVSERTVSRHRARLRASQQLRPNSRDRFHKGQPR